MKPLTIDVADTHAELLAGWRVLHATACDTHGVALVVLIRPTEHAQVVAQTLPQPARHALLECLMQRFSSAVGRIFGIPVAVVQAMTAPASRPTVPPQPPGTKPQEN